MNGQPAMQDGLFLVVGDDAEVVAMSDLMSFQQSGYLALTRFGVVQLPADLDKLQHLVLVLQYEVTLFLLREIGDLLQLTAPV